MRPGGKRIALSLDGPWNTVSDNTNIWRMRAPCAGKSSDGASLNLNVGEVLRADILRARTGAMLVVGAVSEPQASFRHRTLVMLALCSWVLPQR